MTFIEGSSPVYPHHDRGPSQTAFNDNEAQQMDYVLGILHDIISFMSLTRNDLGGLDQDLIQLQDKFATEMKPPVSQKTLQSMEDQLNAIINEMNAKHAAPPFNSWNINADQKRPGYSFMQSMESFAQFLDGESGQDPKIHDWVARLGTFLNKQPWNAQAVFSEVSQFLKAANSLGPNPNNNTFFTLSLPTNIFS